MELEEDHVIFGERLAEAAGKIIRDKFNKNRIVQYKDDGSPVTSADRDAETVMRDMIMEEYPNHGILGEENKSWQEESECLWVLDPIDGTKNFASGFYNFGTLISLVIGGHFALGIINQPVLNQRWIGVALATLWRLLLVERKSHIYLFVKIYCHQNLGLIVFHLILRHSCQG